METAIANREGKSLTITRLFKAPSSLVFEAWTKLEHLAQWYGPDGFTITNISMDLRPGGSWRFTMHGPDGRNYPNKINFIEVVPAKKLVYKHAGEEDTEDIRFSVIVLFQEEGAWTRVTMTSEFDTAEELDRVNREYGAIEGGIQHLNRLATYLMEKK